MSLERDIRNRTKTVTRRLGWKFLAMNDTVNIIKTNKAIIASPSVALNRKAELATRLVAVYTIATCISVAGCAKGGGEPREPNARDLYQVSGAWVQAEYARVLIDTLDESATATRVLGGAAAASDAAHSGGASLLQTVRQMSGDVFPDGDYVWHDQYIPGEYRRFSQRVEGYEFRGEFGGRCYYRRLSESQAGQPTESS